MLDKPEITQTTAQHAAVIRLTIPREEIQKVMGPGIGELMAAVAAQGMTPAGPVFSHHFRIPRSSISRSACRSRNRSLPPAA